MKILKADVGHKHATIEDLKRKSEQSLSKFYHLTCELHFLQIGF